MKRPLYGVLIYTALLTTLSLAACSGSTNSSDSDREDTDPPLGESLENPLNQMVLDSQGVDGTGGNDVGPNGTSTGGGSPGSDASTSSIIALFGPDTERLRPVLQDTGDALITRFGDRGRDRHAREDTFASYDHYLSHYWEHRTIAAEIVDTVGRDANGGSITFNVTTQYKLSDNEAELRFFYYGGNTVAEYHNNGVMTPLDDTHYTRSVSSHGATHEPLKVGDVMEFELSQFLDDSVEEFGGRANYYGTTYLYIVGKGLVPWQAKTKMGSDACPCESEISSAIPEEGWLGGRATLPYQYSNEPRDHFMQMATNLAGDNAQPFVLGRRLVHTEFLSGTHSENSYTGGTIIDNPDFEEQIGKQGPHYVNESCDACHVQNSRAIPPDSGSVLDQYVFLVGDNNNAPLKTAGRVLQPGNNLGASEGTVTLAGWIEEGDLRRPQFSFSGPTPPRFSARIAPQLVGMGLLEAVVEKSLLKLADPGDADGDGISGRMRVVTDPVTGEARMGRFGWKAGQASVKYQIAGALNTDMGVTTSIYPDPDCGSAQSDCGSSGVELSDEDLDNLVRYISLLGMRARRDLQSSTAQEGEELFFTIGCASCHVETLATSPHSFLAEVREQTIHPYTDLLLHDMGPGLADSLDEEGASGAEWRTPPLWNIGLTKDVSQAEAYLHDGRARTLHEAIRWHQGEGNTSRQAYQALSPAERQAVIIFLQSL